MFSFCNQRHMIVSNAVLLGLNGVDSNPETKYLVLVPPVGRRTAAEATSFAVALFYRRPSYPQRRWSEDGLWSFAGRWSFHSTRWHSRRRPLGYGASCLDVKDTRWLTQTASAAFDRCVDRECCGTIDQDRGIEWITAHASIVFVQEWLVTVSDGRRLQGTGLGDLRWPPEPFAGRRRRRQ